MISKNRLNIGNVAVTHRGVLTNTPVGDNNYDSFVSNIDTTFKFEIGFVPPGAAHRPELISNVFYNTPAYWWLLMLVNGVTDPFEGFNEGDQILIPIM